MISWISDEGYKVLRLLIRLDEPCEFLEGHPPARFVVSWRDARPQIVVNGEDIRASVRFGQCECDGYHSAHRGIGCLKLIDNTKRIRAQLSRVTVEQ